MMGKVGVAEEPTQSGVGLTAGRQLVDLWPGWRGWPRGRLAERAGGSFRISFQSQESMGPTLSRFGSSPKHRVVLVSKFTPQ